MYLNWQLHHVGHAVRVLDEGIRFYQDTLGLELVSREIVSDFDVDIAFLQPPHTGTENCTKIELLAPCSDSSSVQRFLDTRGEGLHHICFAVTSVTAELRRLKEKGVRLIDENPRQGAHGLSVAFVHPHSTLGVLLEICSAPENS